MLDKGRNARKYALRQIERAKDHAIDPTLRTMNERHAVIENWGGRCRVATFGRDPKSGRTTITMQGFQDIRDAYLNKKVEIGRDPKTDLPKFDPAGKWWLQHEQRREYREIVFDPSDLAPADCLNLWTGFAVEPKQGDWSLMRSHIVKVLAQGDKSAAEYIIRWAAWAVQNPDKPAETALVLIGGKGSGKGTFGNALCEIFGHHALHIFSADLLVGRFNAHLRDICLLFADEAYWPGHKSAEGHSRG